MWSFCQQPDMTNFNSIFRNKGMQLHGHPRAHWAYCTKNLRQNSKYHGPLWAPLRWASVMLWSLMGVLIWCLCPATMERAWYFFSPVCGHLRNGSWLPYRRKAIPWGFQRYWCFYCGCAFQCLNEWSILGFCQEVMVVMRCVQDSQDKLTTSSSS